MTAAAAWTEHLRFCSLVLSNDFRHPALLAREVATIDLLSGGRLEVGIGAGWAVAEYQRIGLPFARPGERIERLEESLQILKMLLSDGESTFAGKHYSINGHVCAPRPVQAGGPPILIGGGGPRMLRLAAERADIVGIGLDLRSGQNLNPATPEFGAGALASGSEAAIEGSVKIIKEAAGARFDSLELNLLVSHCEVTSNGRRKINDLANRLGVDPEAVETSPHLLVGTVEELRARLIGLRERLGISYFIFRANVLEQVIPLVESLQGM